MTCCEMPTGSQKSTQTIRIPRTEPCWSTARRSDRQRGQQPSDRRSVRDRLARPKKYSFIEHAERNAIFAACRRGECTEGGTLYCPWFACADCARAIIQAGIRLVVGHKQMFDRADGRWCESIAYGNEMLREAAVETRLYGGKIGGVTNLFNGERWEP